MVMAAFSHSLRQASLDSAYISLNRGSERSASLLVVVCSPI